MLAWLRSFLGRPTVTVSSTVKPPPCWGPFSASAYGRHYVSLWRGIDSGLGCNIIAAYDSSSELWSLLPTTGPLPPGQYGGCFVCVGHWLYTFGGEDRVYKNCVNRLNLDTLEWTKVQTSGTQPMKKAYCGLVRVNERTVCCFGGKGIEGPTQPGSTCTSIQWSHGCVQTNEFHLFDIQNGNAHIPGEQSPTITRIMFTSIILNCPIPTFMQVSGLPLSSEERDLLPVVPSPSPWWTNTGQSFLEGGNLAVVVTSMMSTCLTSGPW